MIALYARSYWDLVCAIRVDALVGGKGKLDVAPRRQAGGFGCNAARTLVAIGPVRIVTVVGPTDAARLRAVLPTAVALDPLDPGGDPPLPTTVVIDPAGACRILRDPAETDAPHWRWAAVPAPARAAALHVFGRVPLAFVDDGLAAIRAGGGWTAWCGGAAIAPAALTGFDVACLNLREAAALVGKAGDAPTLARALAADAIDGAVRVVTGGAAATGAAVRRGAAIDVWSAAPDPTGPVATLLGAGDAFAAGFLAAAAFAAGRRRGALAVEAGLAAGHAAAAAVVRGEVGHDG